jgi:hypothetical protein
VVIAGCAPVAVNGRNLIGGTDLVINKARL